MNEDVIKRIEDMTVFASEHAKMNITISVQEAPHSYEFGPANSRHKVYYSTKEDLEKKIRAALEAEKSIASIRTELGMEGLK